MLNLKSKSIPDTKSAPIIDIHLKIKVKIHVACMKSMLNV